MKRIIIAAGGTGGHLFPAQACASDLKKKMDDIEILFVGKNLKNSPRFSRELFDYQDIQSSPFSKNPWKYLTAGPKVLYGVLQSIGILRKFKPQCVVGFGSFHSFPILAAASILSIPFILHESNTIPGKVNSLFSKKALWTGIYFPETQNHLSGLTKITTIPLRESFSESLRPTKHAAMKYFELEEGHKTILMFGGSQGASSLNKIILEMISSFSFFSPIQIIHFTGDPSYTAEAKKCYSMHNIRACVKDFEDNMAYAWAAADISIVRAGALSCAELLTCKVPSILVPYPYASEQHQQRNAEYIEEVVKGGKVLKESTLNPRLLASELVAFLDERNLSKMKENMANYEKGQGRLDFSQLLLQSFQKV